MIPFLLQTFKFGCVKNDVVQSMGVSCRGQIQFRSKKQSPSICKLCSKTLFGELTPKAHFTETKPEGNLIGAMHRDEATCGTGVQKTGVIILLIDIIQDNVRRFLFLGREAVK